MQESKSVGVFKLKNGMWAYRITFMREGKRISKQCSKDLNGNLLSNEHDAVAARTIALAEETQSHKPAPVLNRTVKEVYKEYCDRGRSDRAYRTITKQDSLWNNHIKKRFGNRRINTISVAEVNDYLAELYYVNGYSFMYTESFLKMFYLIFRSSLFTKLS